MKTVQDTHFFSSDSNPGKEYQVIVWSDGTVSCDCPGWTRRVPVGGRTCKHTRKVQFGLQAASVEKPEKEKMGRRFKFSP